MLGHLFTNGIAKKKKKKSFKARKINKYLMVDRKVRQFAI